MLDFKNVEICTDSFIQQLTTILAEEISFSIYKKRIKFKDLNSFILELVKGKLYLASKQGI